MPSYGQLDDEAAWRDEFAAPALKALGDQLRLHWPSAEVGIRGNNVHLRGYHRSRRWIKESSFCTNHTYSVSRTSGDRSGGNSNWSCALDFGGIPQSELFAVCKRLDAAVRAGRLEKITEWYGNFGGDDRVDGWDNISDRIASSDSSHLFHLHMGFDRGRANEDHSDVLAVLTGEDDMPNGLEYSAAWIAQRLSEMAPIVIPANSSIGYTGYSAPNKLAEAINKLIAAGAADETRDATMLAAIQALAGDGGPDAAPIVAAIKAEGEATRVLVEQAHQVEMAELRRAFDAEKAGLVAELDRLNNQAQAK